MDLSGFLFIPMRNLVSSRACMATHRRLPCQDRAALVLDDLETRVRGSNALTVKRKDNSLKEILAFGWFLVVVTSSRALGAS
jgi:hypothetical protein